MAAKERIRFNIRGTIIEIFKSSLNTFPDSKLNKLTLFSTHYDSDKKEYFFDRDPEAFNVILNAFITGTIHIPRHLCVSLIKDEMEFWNIPREKISECCWQVYFRFEESIEFIDEIKRDEEKRLNEYASSDQIKNLRHRIWNILENPGYSRFALGWYYFYLFVVALSTLVFCLSTLPELRIPSYMADLSKHNISKITNIKLKSLLFEDSPPALLAVEMLCLLVFTVELFVHLVVCPSSFEFLKKWLNFINIILVCSMWTTLAFELDKDKIIESPVASVVYLITKAFNMLRLLLLLRLEKQFKAFRVLLLSIRASLRELSLMCMSFFIAVLIFSSLMFYCEIYFPNSSFYNIFITMWWAIVTMTTVGYGELFPTTTVGYFVGSLCTMCGLLILALPIAVIASNFANYYSFNNYRERYLQSCARHKKFPDVVAKNVFDKQRRPSAADNVQTESN